MGTYLERVEMEPKAKKLQQNSKLNQYDMDEDGIVSDAELKQAESIIMLDHEKTKIENEDKKEDAQRNMAWFALAGMLLYPSLVVFSTWVNLDEASNILGNMAPTYFVAVAAIVAAFYGKEAYTKGSGNSSGEDV